MSISKHDQKLILILLGVAVFLAAYFGICKTFNNKKAEVESQISALASQLETLRGFSQGQATYQGEIDRIDKEINAELKRYPSDVRSEDMIMYATQLEEKVGVKIDSISIASPEVVSKFTGPKNTGDSKEIVPMIAVRTGLTINCSLSYDQFKKLLDYIYASSEKTDVDNVSVSYDEATGKLSGVITMDKYFITSADYSYKQTEIPSVAKGKSDPFGTISNAAASPKPSTSPKPTTTPKPTTSPNAG